MEQRKINTFREVPFKRNQITISDSYQLALGTLLDNLTVDETGDIIHTDTDCGEMFEKNGYTYFLLNGQSFDETKHTKLFQIRGTKVLPNATGRYLKATNSSNSLELKPQRFPKHKHKIDHTHVIQKHSHTIKGTRVDVSTVYFLGEQGDSSAPRRSISNVSLEVNQNFTINSIFEGNSSGFESLNPNLIKSDKIFSKGSKTLYYIKSRSV